MRKIVLYLFISISIHCSSQQKTALKKALSDKDIIAFMDTNATLLLKGSKANSVSIGVLKNGKTYTKHYGELDKGKGNKATNQTLFEIASVTKVFTGTLMVKAVLEGKIHLEDDIRKYMTGSYPNLEFKGTPITIKDLVSFKSGFSKDLPDRSELLKIRNDTILFYLKKMEESYTKKQFFEDLKAIQLDTVPGKVYKYSNASVQLAAHILENVYQKNYETLLKENLFLPLSLKNTKLYTDQNDIVANGYNERNILMPSMPLNLWGAAGSLKSTLPDLITFLKYQLDSKNAVATESQRNLYATGNFWQGYFWDAISINSSNERSARKHGGAMSTQNLFAIYPDYDMGISIIINQSDENTYSHLFEALQNIVDDLKPFGKKSIAKAIQGKCFENIDAGIDYYKNLKKTKNKDYNFSDQDELNTLGYKLMGANKIRSAIKIFKLLTLEFPNSGNAFDSLGESYFKNTEYDLALYNYTRSLELDPMNNNAKEMLVIIKELTKKTE